MGNHFILILMKVLALLVAVASAHQIHSHHRHRLNDENPAENLHFNYYSNEKESNKFEKYPNTSLDGVAEESFAQHAILEKATKYNRYSDANYGSDIAPKETEKPWYAE